MEKSIDQILNELYAIDAGLREHESDLKVIVAKLLESRPDTKFDEAFARRLRSELLARTASAPAPARSFLNGFAHLPKFAYVLGGAALILIIVLPFLPILDLGLRGGQAPSFGFEPGLQKLQSRAFGPLGTVVALNGQAGVASLNAEMDSIASPVPRTVMGMGGDASVSSAPMAFDEKAAIMPYYEPVAYEYIYEGEALDQVQAEMAVFRQTKTDAGSRALARYITSLKLGLIDVSRFQNTEVANLSINEDREFGYSLNLNLSDNSMYIYANWEKWPHPENLCRDEACFEQYRLKQSDVPSDDSIIAIADRFLADYGISRDHYGKPVIIENNYRILAARTEEMSTIYVPDEIAVVYPLAIDGQTVYETSGQPSGLNVSVNVRHMRVSNVGQITAASFESSAYPALSAATDIMRLAEQGGLYPDYRPDDAAKTVEVKLGTPVLSLIKYWQYDEGKGIGTELFVPAYIFPITNREAILQDTPYFYREQIVVPLIKEIADRIVAPGDMPVSPMPVDGPLPVDQPLPTEPGQTEPTPADSPDSPVDSGAGQPGIPEPRPDIMPLPADDTAAPESDLPEEGAGDDSAPTTLPLRR